MLTADSLKTAKTGAADRGPAGPGVGAAVADAAAAGVATGGVGEARAQALESRASGARADATELLLIVTSSNPTGVVGQKGTPTGAKPLSRQRSTGARSGFRSLPPSQTIRVLLRRRPSTAGYPAAACAQGDRRRNRLRRGKADKYPPPQSKSERIWCLTNDRNRANMELSGNVPGKLPGNILERLT